MTSLVRLLKLVRRLNVYPKTTLSRRNTLGNATFQRLLHSQALLFTSAKNEFATASTAQGNREANEDCNMINLFQHEIQNYGRLRKVDVDKLLEDVKESGVVSSLQGLFLLQCCSELMSNKSTYSRRLLADEIWKTLKELDVQLDVSHYNALLNVYADTDYQYSPTDFLEEMVNAGIKPNRVTFQKLIAQYCNEGQISEASQISNHAKSKGISDNEDMLSSFVYGHFMNNDDDAALKILNDMEKLGTPITIKTYSTLLYVYANRGEIDNIKKTLEECEGKGVWVPDKVLLRIIHNLSLYGFSQYVDEILTLTCKGNAYLREATRAIHKLVEQHHYETAFKIYQTLPERRTIIGGNMFLQALISANVPIEKSIEYCRLMEAEKLNPRAFLSAVQKSIANDMYESSIKLLKAWKELGGVIRSNYFLPILKAHGETGQYEEMVDILQKMISEFELQPSIYTLTEGVIPYMQCDGSDDILCKLLGYRVHYVRASNAVLIHLLKRNEIRKAVELMRNFTMEYRAELVKSSLLNAFKNTEDVPSFITILYQLYMIKLCHENRLVEGDGTVVPSSYSREFVDSIISETVDFILSKDEPRVPFTTMNKKYLALAVFRNLIDRGINLSPAVADDIKEKLSNEMTPQIEEALTILKSEVLIPKPIKSEIQNMGFENKLTNMKQLESLVKLMSVRDRKATLIYKRKLLYYYCNLLNYEKMAAILEDLRPNEISSSTHATIIDTLLRMNKNEEAELWLLSARGMIPDFRMSQILLLKLATALAEDGHFERALNCLNQPTISSTNRQLVTCTKFLSAVMQFDDENYLLQAFDILKENGYIVELENHLFTPLVLLYLKRRDNKAALEKFQWVHKVYDLAPCQIQLMKAFIKSKDHISLDQVTSIAKSVDGPLTSYFNLALAHLENSQFLKAKEVIEKFLPNLPEKLVFERVLYYCNEGQIDNLENFFEILNILNYDVRKLSVVLLKAFGHYNKREKGYKLWMKLQEENIKPSNTFYDYLNLVMNKKACANSLLHEFSEAIDRNDELKARELLNKLPLFYKSDGYSRLCKRSCNRENFSDVIDLCKDLYNRFNLDIHAFDAEVILDTMLKKKDVASLEKIGMCMSQKLKHQIKYNFYLNRAYLISGSWNLYLKDIEKRLEEGTLNWLNVNMHIKTTVESLFQHPELLEQYESIAKLCHEKNIFALIHILWIYYFFNDETKAQVLWSQYIKNSEVSTWFEIRNSPRITPVMYIKIAELLKESALRESRKLKGFTSLIRRAIQSDHSKKYEIGLNCLLHGTETLPMERYDINLLVKLQTGLENSGIQWPWSRRKSNVAAKKQVENVVKAIMELYK